MKKTLVIAEAGVNHNGDLDVAKKLIDAAIEAGADIVKFQTFNASALVTKHASKADYQQAADKTGSTQLEMLRALELSEADHDELIAYCNSRSIEFLSTPFDIESISLLKKKGIKIGKIPSGEVTNKPFLKAMATNFPNLILSTGMCDLEDVQNALNVLYAAGAKSENITVLHCTTEYPAPLEEVNLKAMQTMGEEFGLSFGYSDHTEGVEVAIGATALGASLIEKHFTLDRNMPGPDHRASLEPADLKTMITAIRNIDRAMGDGIKKPAPSEMKNRNAARKSLIAARNLEPGETLSENDIHIKRPGSGISPMKIDEIIGRKLTRAVSADTPLNEKDFQ